jgi:hypothetical protein
MRSILIRLFGTLLPFALLILAVYLANGWINSKFRVFVIPAL